MFRKIKSRILKGERGVTLIEVVISIAILGVIAAGIVGYFQWSFGIFGYTDRKATAESLARSQMEQVKSTMYNSAGVYPTIIPPDSNYSITSSSSNVTGINGMQKIVVTVTGPLQANGQPLNITLEGYKLSR
jgi:prepilin-type N-terminal cleavage/methylation domain-containing protein